MILGLLSRNLLVALLFVWSTATQWVSVAGAEPKQGAANYNLRGRVVIKFPDGRVVPATSAKVYIFYASGFVSEGYWNRYWHFTHEPTWHTAGGLFSFRSWQLVLNDKVLQGKEKTPPNADPTLEIAERSLRYTDLAIAETIDWSAEHPKDDWQVLVITPDEQGSWAANVKPGSYEVVIRGVVSKLDAGWTFSWDVAPDKTYSLEKQPSYFQPLKDMKGASLTHEEPNGVSSVKAGEQQATKIVVRFIDGTNGKPISDKAVNIWLGSERVFWRDTDSKGQITLDIGRRPQVVQPPNLAVAPDLVFDCRSTRDDVSGETLKYSLNEIGSKGVVGDNLCGTVTAPPTPNALILFMRPRTSKEKRDL